MITKVQIKNFRCIHELEVDLEPLTVLVGANASGKSSVLAALARGFEGSQLRRGASTGSGSVHRREARGRPLPAFSIYQFELRAMRQPNHVQEAPLLEGNGGNLANAFATLPRREQAALAVELAQLVDVFGDVDVRPLGVGRHQLVFQDRWNENTWFETNQVSDGTMMVLAFLVLQHQNQRPETVLIEEPERGLHPFLLGKIIDLLRDISQGKHGPPTQFVLATQSAELLEHVRPEEVRFLERDADGGVKVSKAPTEDSAWADAIDVYENSMGQMWLSGSLGGVPSM